MIEFGRVHQLEILFILGVGPRGDFVEPLAEMAVVGAATLFEGLVEVIVTGHAGRWNEAAYGKGMDQRVVKRLIFVGVGCGKLAASAASVSWLGERKRSYVDAVLVFRRGANPGFRVDGATQMIVEVRAFGHFLEQVAKLQRVRTRCVEVESRSEERRVGKE